MPPKRFQIVIMALLARRYNLQIFEAFHKTKISRSQLSPTNSAYSRSYVARTLCWNYGHRQEDRGTKACHSYLHRLYWNRASIQQTYIPRFCTSADSRIASADKDFEWPLRQIYVNTPTAVPEEYPDGVTMSVKYIDTGTGGRPAKEVPTLVLIPGAPGSHLDLTLLINLLVEKHFRVVVLNMPGFGYTEGYSEKDDYRYSNTVPENAEFIVSAIGALKLPRVDVLVGHSAGSLPLPIISVTTNITKAIVSICSPPGHQLPRKVWPFFLIKRIPKLWDSKLLRPLIGALVSIPYKMKGFTKNRAEDMINSIKIVNGINQEMMSTIAVENALKNKPVLFVSTENDPIFSFCESEGWARLLGMKAEDRVTYSEDEAAQYSKPRSNGEVSYPRWIEVASGGHYPQTKELWAPLLTDEIAHLLSHVSDLDNKPR